MGGGGGKFILCSTNFVSSIPIIRTSYIKRPLNKCFEYMQII